MSITDARHRRANLRCVVEDSLSLVWRSSAARGAVDTCMCVCCCCGGWVVVVVVVVVVVARTSELAVDAVALDVVRVVLRDVLDDQVDVDVVEGTDVRVAQRADLAAGAVVVVGRRAHAAEVVDVELGVEEVLCERRVACGRERWWCVCVAVRVKSQRRRVS